MLEYVLGMIEVPENLRQGILRHEVQAVNVNNPDIARNVSAVMFYWGHDVIRGDSSYEHTQTYCLKMYRGSKKNKPLHSPFLKDYDDGQLQDLAERSNGKLTLDSLRPVRDLVKQLNDESQISRAANKCSQCMRMDFQVAEAQRGQS
ncbi:hypothetical protein HYX08_03050 [Candidatus Woesearchaeota archaeon]|nr:hypothetical protein [Candidatus Woesearchaeota archaeon]